MAKSSFTKYKVIDHHISSLSSDSSISSSNSISAKVSLKCTSYPMAFSAGFNMAVICDF